MNRSDKIFNAVISVQPTETLVMQSACLILLYDHCPWLDGLSQLFDTTDLFYDWSRALVAREIRETDKSRIPVLQTRHRLQNHFRAVQSKSIDVMMF